jgi:hypothetical protein
VPTYLCNSLESPVWSAQRKLGLQLLKTLANFYAEVFKSEGVLAKLPELLEGSSAMLGSFLTAHHQISSHYVTEFTQATCAYLMFVLVVDAALEILPLVGNIHFEFPLITK